jgi:S1-C subfamily serine protease
MLARRVFGATAATALLAMPTVAGAQSVGDVFRRVSQSVVTVYVAERQAVPGAPGEFVSVGGQGSGVLISNNGEILTAAHVVQASEQIMVEFPDGQQIRARVVSSFPAADLALLRLERKPTAVPPATLGNSDSVDVGDQVFVVGAPLGVTHSLTVGYVSARRTMNRTFGALVNAELLQTDAAINQGNSGGPMFNLQGEVVGIVSYILSTSGGFQGLGFAITSNMARDLVMTGPTVWSGIDGYHLPADLGKVFNVPPPHTGLLVQRVASGGLGDALGLEGGFVSIKLAEQENLLIGGDIVLSVNGVAMSVEDLPRIQDVFARLRPGSPIRVTALRAGEIIELVTTYSPRP